MNKKDQSASGATVVEPVTEKQSDSLVNLTKNYPGGKDGLQLALAHPECRRRIWAILDQLRDEQILRSPLMERPIWKPIKLGTGLKNRNDFVNAIEKAGGRVRDWAKDLLGRPGFTVSSELTEVNLVIVTGSDLGFTKAMPRKDIYEKALSLGYKLCPPEVGPQLRLQYMDQPKGEWLLVAMEPIVDSRDGPCLFDVEHDDDGLWLICYCDCPDDVWVAGGRWVFVRK
ncbi:TPA: hypothetical protein DIV45_00210 [Patescibacteria group bacterium]|nr:hypothetical protein [Patescibacteria group bacterium]